MLSRRGAIVALLSMPLGYYRAFAQSTLPTGLATLTVDLNKWKGIQVTFGGKTTFVASAEMFAALIEEPE